MSLIGRSMLKTVAGKRFFSAAAQSPKIAIAQNILLLKEIANAADEAALAKITAKGLPTVDIANPPKELEDFKAYFALSDLKTSEKFIPDPTAWQNMSPLDYAGTELQRAETWPFFVGFVSVVLLLGFGVGAALPKESRNHSKYVAMLEGRKGHDDHH